MKKLSIAIITLLSSGWVHAATSPAPLSAEQQLGQQLYLDKNLSLNRNQACASCHSLQALNVGNQKAITFVDEENVKKGSPVSGGSKKGSFGGLNAPSAGYAAFSPPFHLDTKGNYVGGQFWNGRARDLQEQAKGPFLNPAEMAIPNAWAIVTRLQENPKYLAAFKALYALDLKSVPKYKANAQQPIAVDGIYNQVAHAISEFEKSRVFNKFNSKFDYVLAGKTNFTPLEKQGLDVFNGKAKCSSCHTSEVKTDANGKKVPPLFTDFTYDNAGLPRNVNIPKNPEPDLGLGGRDDIAIDDPDGLQIGKHKVMTLRNIAVTAPYGHNGVFKNLAQVVHFYNTRDTLGVVADNKDPNFGITGWPVPEVADNLNTKEMGDLKLTAAEEKALVAFLKTLTDDYPVWGKDPRVPAGTASPFAPVALPK